MPYLASCSCSSEPPPAELEQAKAHCQQCPLRADCLAGALERAEPCGVWGGEIFGIVGPNGAGKTTTVESIEGLRVPDRGRIRVLGLDPRRDAAELHQRVGVQLQDSQLPDRLRVAEALELYASFYRQPADWRELLAMLGLAGKTATAFRHLSGGERQRLSAAQPIGALLFFPMMFFAGLWLPIAAMPSVLRHISHLTPLGAAVQALGDASAGQWPHPLNLAVLAGYAVVLSAAAVKFFRWE